MKSICLLLLLPLYTTAASERITPNESELPPQGSNIVVCVNGTTLTATQLRKIITWRATRAPQPPPAKHLQDFRDFLLRETVKQFVMKTLLAEEANRRKITLTDEEVAQALENLPTPEGMTAEAYLNLAPMGREQVWTDFTNSLRVTKMISFDVDQPVTETEREALREEYAQQRLDQRGLAHSLYRRLLQGADFTKLAKSHSDCSSAAQGGNLGRFRRNAKGVPPEFEVAAFTQKTGVIGEPIKSEYGYHIIQVLEHIPAEENAEGHRTPDIVHARHILLKIAPEYSNEQLEKRIRQRRPDRLLHSLVDAAEIKWYITPVPIP